MYGTLIKYTPKKGLVKVAANAKAIEAISQNSAPLIKKADIPERVKLLALGLGGLGLLGGLNTIPYWIASSAKDKKYTTRMNRLTRIGSVLQGAGMGGAILPVAGHVGGGLVGVPVGEALMEHHNRSRENELALAALAAEAQKEKENQEKSASSSSMQKKATLIGALVGALHPKMSAAGGAVRGEGIATGSLLGAAGGGTLGALLGAGTAMAVGKGFERDLELGTLLGAAIGGVPGAILGGRLGWKKAKEILNEHAQASPNNPARKAGL